MLKILMPGGFNEEGKKSLGAVQTFAGLLGEQVIQAFISYSHTDQSFARSLADILAGHQRKIWIDDADIFYGEPWSQVIEKGIEGAGHFVFLLSPESVISQNCLRELAYAVRNHKRIVPVLCRPVDRAALPPALSEPHWIKPDSPEGAARALLEAFDKDPEEVRAHTRLLTRAKEWIRREQDPSLLLRGSDLRMAEQWLAQLGPRSPQPTPEQSQYVAASRRSATWRQNVLLSAVTTGLVTVAFLAVLYWSERNQAKEQAVLALSRQLAAQANVATAGSLDRALLLALEANRLSDAVDVRGSLLDALRASRHAGRVLHGHQSGQRRGVMGLAFSPDGGLLASGSEDRTIRFWDVLRGTPVGAPLRAGKEGVTSVAFSPDGAILASANEDGTLLLWDVVARRLRSGQLQGHNAAVMSIAFDSSGKILASAGYDNRVILWDTATGKKQAELANRVTTRLRNVAFGKTASLLAAAGDGTHGAHIVLWNTIPGDPIELAGHSDSVRQIAFSPDGRTLASGSYDQTAILWDVSRHRPRLQPLVQHEGTVFGVAFSPNGGMLATASYDQTVALWDARSGELLEDPFIAHGDRVFSVAFSPDRRMLATGDGKGAIFLWDLTIRDPLTRVLRARDTAYSRIGSLSFGAKGRLLAAGDNRAAVLWDVPTGRMIDRIVFPENPYAYGETAVSPDGRLLAVGDASGEILLWDVQGRRFFPPLVGRSGSDYVTCLAISPKGRVLASGRSDGSVLMWDLATRRPIDLPSGKHEDSVQSLAFHPGGEILVSGGESGEIWMWDLGRRRELTRLPSAFSRLGPIYRLAFAPRGGTVAAAGIDGTVRLWDMVAHRWRNPPLVAEKSNAPIYDLAFSPDGKTLATSGMNTTVTLWDVTTGERLGQPFTDAGSHVAWSPDGETLAVSGGRLRPSPRRRARADSVWNPENDTAVLLIDMGLNSWKRRACEIANRPLSREEWERYLGDRPYEPACLSGALRKET